MKRAWPYVLFAALTLLVFWKFPLKGQTIYGPPTGHILWFGSDVPPPANPDNVLILPVLNRIYNEGLKQGELRLWNPHLFCGYPVYSDPMIHPFYPPHLALHFLLPPDAAYEMSLLLHFFFSGVTMFWALRALGRSDAAATAGALVWMLLGYHAIWFSTCVLLGVCVFGPLALKWITEGLERRDRSRAALAAAAMGMAILGSQPQYALLLFLFLAAWIVVKGLGTPRFTIPFACIFGVLSVGIALVEVFSRLDTLAQGFRAADPTFEIAYGKPATVLGYALGLVMGKVWYPESILLRYEFTLYAGVAASMMALAGVVRGFREPAIRFVAVAAGIALVVTFVSPVAELMTAIPLLKFGLPARFLFLFGLCLAILAARGLDAMLKRPGLFPHLLVVVATGLVLFCLIRVGSSGPAWETIVGAALATAALFLIRPLPPAGVALLSAALIFDLLPLFININDHSGIEPLQKGREAAEHVTAEKEPSRATGSLYPGSRPSKRDLIAAANHLAFHGLENVAGFDAIIPANYTAFSRAAGAHVEPAGHVILYPNLESPLVDAANLKYLFAHHGAPVPERFRPVRSWGNLKLYENTAALARARVVGSAALATSPKEALELLESTDLRQSAVLETPSLPPLGSRPLVSRVEWLHRSPDRVELEVSSSRDALLVLADNAYAGWEAEVAGKPVPVYRANATFRAVAVSPGTHRVEFRFRPDSVRIGIVGSLAFTILALGIAALRRVKAGLTQGMGVK